MAERERQKRGPALRNQSEKEREQKKLKKLENAKERVAKYGQRKTAAVVPQPHVENVQSNQNHGQKPIEEEMEA